MKTRQEVLEFGLKLDNTYQEAPFHDDNWQLVRVKPSKQAFLERRLANIDESVRTKTSRHIIALFEECGRNTIFGRSIVEKITGLKSSRASEIINLMLECEIIEPVKGYGKGKYRFR